MTNLNEAQAAGKAAGSKAILADSTLTERSTNGLLSVAASRAIISAIDEYRIGLDTTNAGSYGKMYDFTNAMIEMLRGAAGLRITITGD